MRRGIGKSYLGILITVCLVLGGCGSVNGETEPIPTEAPKQTEAPKLTEAPTVTEEPKQTEAPIVTAEPEATGVPEDTEPLEADMAIQQDKTITPLSVNTTVSVDLDGDGKEELVNTVFSKGKSDFTEYPQIRVDDYVFDKEYMQEVLMLYMETPDIATWYIFDVDLQDGYKEIAVYEDGPSGDPWTTLLRYENGQLREIGGFSDKPIDDWSIYYEEYDGDFQAYVDSIDRSQIRIKVAGDGTIYARQRIDVMETNFAEGLWKLENADSFAEATLELQEREMYEIYGFGSDRSEFTPTVRTQLQVFVEADMESEMITLSQGENIDIYRYYPQDGWIQIAYHNLEKYGWLKRKAYDGIYQVDENGEGVYLSGYELIENLSYAD